MLEDILPSIVKRQYASSLAAIWLNQTVIRQSCYFFKNFETWLYSQSNIKYCIWISFHFVFLNWQNDHFIHIACGQFYKTSSICCAAVFAAGSMTNIYLFVCQAFVLLVKKFNSVYFHVIKVTGVKMSPLTDKFIDMLFCPTQRQEVALDQPQQCCWHILVL